MAAGAYNGFKGELKNHTRDKDGRRSSRRSSGGVDSTSRSNRSEAGDNADGTFLLPQGGRWDRFRKDSQGNLSYRDSAGKESVSARESVDYSENKMPYSVSSRQGHTHASSATHRRRSSVAESEGGRSIAVESSSTRRSGRRRSSLPGEASKMSGMSGRTNRSGGSRRTDEKKKRGSLGGLFAGL